MDLNRRASMAGLLALATSPACAKAAKPASPWAALEAQAKTLVTERLTPGVEICVRKHGAVVFSKGFGLANLETATPMSPASICRIGSITKQFTAAAVLLLAQDGKLSLDDSLSLYVPDFPNAHRLSLRRMLSHTSGLGNYTAVNPALFFQASRTDRNARELVQAMADASPNLAYEPGTDWRYSNTAFVLLGVVIETVAARSYAEFMQTRLFAPLGLTHTSVDDAARVVRDRASGYTSAPRAAGGFDNASFIAMSYPGGAGSMRSTAGELCAWHGALLGGKVLQPESLEAMLTPVRLNDGALPTVPSRTGGRDPVSYGFGIGLEPHSGKPAISHGGGIQGFSSYLETLPDEQITFATLMNTDGGPFAPKALMSAPGELQATIRAAARAL